MSTPNGRVATLTLTVAHLPLPRVSQARGLSQAPTRKQFTWRLRFRGSGFRFGVWGLGFRV